MSRTLPELDPAVIFHTLGGAAGLHARLARAGFPGVPPLGTIRTWKSRTAIPGRWVVPILILLGRLDEHDELLRAAKTTDDTDLFAGFGG